jgi:hypothetical protein
MVTPGAVAPKAKPSAVDDDVMMAPVPAERKHDAAVRAAILKEVEEFYPAPLSPGLEERSRPYIVGPDGPVKKRKATTAADDAPTAGPVAKKPKKLSQEST